MILDELQLTVDRNKDKSPLYVRNLLKERLQYFLLDFVYNSPYADSFLFKGGTCLRFCFDLPRLSEDLDFDVTDFESFSHEQFAADLQEHFKNKLHYTDFAVTISGVNKIMYLKFPILNQLGFPTNAQKPSENTLSIRIDLAPIIGDGFMREISLKSSYNFSFLIRRYSLADLYAGKIAAILGAARFKGRDYFDLWWLHEKKIQWNKNYLQSLTNITSNTELIAKLHTKIQEAARRKQELQQDLLPFFENPSFVKDVVNNLNSLTFDTAEV